MSVRRMAGSTVFSANLPMEETLNLDGIVNGDKMCLKWEIEDLSIHIIHSRKNEY